MRGNKYDLYEVLIIEEIIKIFFSNFVFFWKYIYAHSVLHGKKSKFIDSLIDAYNCNF